MSAHAPAGTADLATLARIASGSAAQMGDENFPVALRLLPRPVRTELAAVYRYARFVDDVGDGAVEGGVDTVGAAGRLRLLDAVERDVAALPHGTAQLTPVLGLAELTRRHAVPLGAYTDLVEANRLDQRVTGYPSFEALLGYCTLSAAPVGRIVLHLADAAGTANVAASDAVCSALQVLEHCQDVGEDARAGRVYLPADDLAADGLDADGVTATARSDSGTPPALRRVIARQVERSRELLRHGRPLVRRLEGWARIAVAGYLAGGLATADALDAAGGDVLGRLVRPSKARTLRHAAALVRPW